MVQSTTMQRDVLNYLIKAGRIQEARQILRSRADMLAPVTAACLEGITLAKEGQLEEAIACVRRVAELDEPDPTLQQVLSALLCMHALQQVQEGHIEEACSQLLEARKVCRDDPAIEEYLEEFHSALAAAYAQSGQWGELESLLERRLSQDPRDPLTYHHLAVLHQSLALEAEGNSEDKKADEHWQAAHAYWGVVLASDEFWARWHDQCQKRYQAEVSQGDAQKVRHDLPGRLVRLHRELRDSHLAAKRKEGARRQQEHEVSCMLEYRSAQAVGRALALLEKLQRTVGLPCPLGIGAAQRQGFSEELENLCDTLKAADANSHEYVSLAKYLGSLGRPAILVEVGRPGEAVERLEELLESKSSLTGALLKEGQNVYVTACLRYSSELTNQGKHTRAADLLERALKTTNRDEIREALVGLCLDWAQKLYHDDKYADADRVIDRGLKLAPGHQALAWLGKRNLLAWAGEAARGRDWPTAIRRLEKAERLVPDDPEVRKALAFYHRNQGVVLWNSGNRYEGRSHVKTAISYDPTDVELLQLLSQMGGDVDVLDDLLRRRFQR